MKILVLRYAAIGDCIMSAWAVTALRRAMPEAEIHWAIQPRCEAVVDEERLARTRVVPREKKKGEGSNLAVLRYWIALRREKYDLGIDLQGHSKTALALRFAAPKRRAGLRATDALVKALNPLHSPPEGLTHIIEKEGWLVEKLTGAELPLEPLMPRLEGLREPWRRQPPWISIQTGAGSADKVVPPHYWEAVAANLRREGIPVVAMGGPNDPQLAGVHNLAGSSDLAASLACVAESRVHLAADTGTGHAAAAYGVPTVSVFGPTNPAKCRPWGPAVTVLKRSKSTADVSPDEIISAALEAWRMGA